MCANCTRCSGRASAFAPASMRTLRPRFVGMTIAIPGRWTPGRRRMWRSDAASIAPVFPAETTASASPSATARTAGRATSQASIAPRRRRGRPSRSTRPPRRARDRGSRVPAARRGWAGSRGTQRRLHPATISSGARSPPSASTATRITRGVSTARRGGAARRPDPCTSCSSGRPDAVAWAACRSGRPGRAGRRSRAARGACRASTSRSFASGRP